MILIRYDFSSVIHLQKATDYDSAQAPEYMSRNVQAWLRIEGEQL